MCFLNNLVFYFILFLILFVQQTVAFDYSYSNNNSDSTLFFINTNEISSLKESQFSELNVTEILRRFPNVYYERTGLQGKNIMIRGMEAKYTNIKVDGVEMAASGWDDRSVDLSMISPVLFDGIILSKIRTANQEASAIAGTVDFVLAKAREKCSMNLTIQSGVKNFSNYRHDMKFSFGMNSRFFHDLFGINGQIDYQEKDLRSQHFGEVNFNIIGFSTLPLEETSYAAESDQTFGFELKDQFRFDQQLGGTLVFDLTLPFVEIKFSNLLTRVLSEETHYINSITDGEYFTKSDRYLSLKDLPKKEKIAMINSLQVKHQLNGWRFKYSFNHSYSKYYIPNEISTSTFAGSMNFSGFKRHNVIIKELNPEKIADSLSDIDPYYLENFCFLDRLNHKDTKTDEDNYSLKLDISKGKKVEKHLYVEIALGAKVKWKEKKYDRNVYTMNDIGFLEYKNRVLNYLNDQFGDDIPDHYSSEIPIELFLDHHYDKNDFFKGKYDLGYVIDKEKIREIYNISMDHFNPQDTSTWTIFQKDPIQSDYNDYFGHEYYKALYLMTEIELYSRLKISPGIRFESNRTQYTGFQGDIYSDIDSSFSLVRDTVTDGRTKAYWLPVVNISYYPLKCLGVELAYTHNLKRPDFNHIVPVFRKMNWKYYGADTIGNPTLIPEFSKDLDLKLSTYSSNLGLFSISYFQKIIYHKVCWSGVTSILDRMLLDFPLCYSGSYMKNDSNLVYNKGIELDWYANFFNRKGWLKNLSIHLNYSYNQSVTNYCRPRTIYFNRNDQFFEESSLNRTGHWPNYNDTTYKSPLLYQPQNLLNLTMGYQYKQLALRYAVRYKSKILSNTNFYEESRSYSTGFYRYDLFLTCQIWKKGVEFFLNCFNLTDQSEYSKIEVFDFTSYREYYGRSLQFGFRYSY